MNFEVLSSASLGILLLCSLPVLCILAAGGAPLLALTGERQALARKRVFLDKLGGQLGAMAGILALCTLPFSLGLWLMSWAGNWLFLSLERSDLPLPEFSLALAGPANLLTAGVYALALALVTAYWLTWKPWRTRKDAHSLLGVLAVAAAAAAVLLAVGLRHGVLASPGLLPADIGLERLAATFLQGPLPALLAGHALALAVSAGAGLGLCYLLLRRNKEDFGRDYYAFACKQAAEWGLVGGSLALFLGGWLSFALMPGLAELRFNDAVAQFHFLGLLCLFMSCICWALVQGSAAPLRLKPAMVLGAAFLWLSVFLQTVTLRLALPGV